MIRKKPFLCKEEIQRDYFHQKDGGCKMVWYPDKDATIETTEE